MADAEAGAAVALRPDRLPPPAIVEIPGDGLAQARREVFTRLPAEFAPDFRRIHRIAPVMAGPIGDEGDQPRVRAVRRLWLQLVEQVADQGHNVEIAALGVAADIVALARAA